jgi:hypothetical protein
MDGAVSFRVTLHNTGPTDATIDAKALRIFVLRDQDHLPDLDGSFEYKDELVELNPLVDELTVRGKHSAVLSTSPHELIFKSNLDPDAGDGTPNYVVVFGHLEYQDKLGNQDYVSWGWLVDVGDARMTKLTDGPLTPSGQHLGEFMIDKQPIPDDVAQKVISVGLSK